MLNFFFLVGGVLEVQRNDLYSSHMCLYSLFFCSLIANTNSKICRQTHREKLSVYSHMNMPCLDHYFFLVQHLLLLLIQPVRPPCGGKYFHNEWFKQIAKTIGFKSNANVCEWVIVRFCVYFFVRVFRPKIENWT